MIECYKTIKETSKIEIIEKKSRFIASAAFIETETMAKEFLAKSRKEFYNANHNVYAYVLGLKGEILKQSDDGEPSGTSGMPTLNAIRSENLVNTMVIVTRYFGGILLGSGGLTRAYGKAARESLIAAGIAEKVLHGKFNVIINYPLLGKIRYEYERLGYKICAIEYGEEITLEVLAKYCLKEKFTALTSDLTNGTAIIQFKEDIYQ